MVKIFKYAKVSNASYLWEKCAITISLQVILLTEKRLLTNAEPHELSRKAFFNPSLLLLPANTQILVSILLSAAINLYWVVLALKDYNTIMTTDIKFSIFITDSFIVASTRYSLSKTLK